MQMNPPVVGVMVTNQWNASPQDNRSPTNFQALGITLTNNVPFQFAGITNNGGTVFTMRLSTDGQCTNSPIVTTVADAGTSNAVTNIFPMWDFFCMRGGCYDDGLHNANIDIDQSIFDGPTNLVCSGQHGHIYLNWHTNLPITITAQISSGTMTFWGSIPALLGPPVTADTWRVAEFVNTNLALNAVMSNNIVTNRACHLEWFGEFILDQGQYYNYPDDCPVLCADTNLIFFGMGGEDSVGGSFDFSPAINFPDVPGPQQAGGTQIYWEPNWGNYCLPFIEYYPSFYNGGSGNSGYRYFDQDGRYSFACTNSMSFVKTNANGNAGQTDAYIFTYRTIP
jgi:hypothetical protein